MFIHARPVFLITLMSAVHMLSGCGEAPKSSVPPPPAVTISRPAEQQVTKYLEFTGNTAALQSVDIRARVQGFLESVDFEPRSKVKAGALLFVIDPKPYKAKVEQAAATLEARKASLELAQVEYEKAKQLESKDAISQIKFLEQTAKRDIAKAEADQAKADLDAAQLDLGYTQVKSPINGRVGRNLVDVGNLVGANEKTLLTTVVNDESLYVYFSVNELDLLAIRRKYPDEKDDSSSKDQPVPVYVSLADETGFPHEGRLDFGDTQMDQSTGTLQVRAIISNKDGLLLAGMFVRVRVPLEKKTELLVPDVAVLADQGGRYVLVVNKDDVVEQRQVKRGELIDRMRAIEEGLKKEDRVVVNGIQKARPGSKVNPTEAPAKPASVAEPGKTPTPNK